jgi:hypothetical protein
MDRVTRVAKVELSPIGQLRPLGTLESPSRSCRWLTRKLCRYIAPKLTSDGGISAQVRYLQVELCATVICIKPTTTE